MQWFLPVVKKQKNKPISNKDMHIIRGQDQLYDAPFTNKFFFHNLICTLKDSRFKVTKWHSLDFKTFQALNEFSFCLAEMAKASNYKQHLFDAVGYHSEKIGGKISNCSK